MFDDIPEWRQMPDIERLSAAELDMLKSLGLRRARALRSQAVAAMMRRLWTMPSAWLARFAWKSAPAERPRLCQSLKERGAS